MRLSAIFVSLCVAVIALSLGVTAHVALGFSVVESAAAALVIASLIATAQVTTERAHERAEASRQIAELSRGTTELARQVGELGRRVMAAEAALARGREDMRAATAPLGTEIELLGGLVQQLAESVAVHDAVLAQRLVPAIPALHAYPNPPDASQPAPPAAPSEPVALGPAAGADESPRTDSMSRTCDWPAAAAASHEERIAAPGSEIVAAINNARIELYLQPIVTLPQRKVRHYEATVRLRMNDGSLLAPSDYAASAESAGLMPVLDDLMLLRTAQVARRITGRSRDAALFCSLGAATVAEAGFFSRFADFLAVNVALAPALVLGVPQSALADMGPLEQEGMAQLARLGVRFCLDRVTDPRIEPRDLTGLNIRFVRAPAAVLLDGEAHAASEIHTADLTNLLGRFGIDLIVYGIDSERVVVDLLDFDVRFGQGELFASPRPVRSDAVEPAASPQPANAANARALAPDSAAAPQPLPPGPRRRESEQASQRPGAERTPQALAQLARNLMRRA